MTAPDVLMQIYRRTLPPDVPTPWAHIKRARFLNRTHRAVTATVRLWDGVDGTLIVKAAAHPFEDRVSVRWLDIGGSAVHWNGRSWERVSEALE